MSDPDRPRPNPIDDPIRIADGISAKSTPKTFHFVVEGDPACEVRRQDTKAISSSSIRGGDRPCEDCLREVAPDRECGETRRSEYSNAKIDTLVTCPVCCRWLVPLGVGHHIGTHAPEDFGLSPLGETVDPDPSQRVATDGGEQR